MPLAVARRRYGLYLVPLSLVGLIVVLALLLAQAPLALRGSGMILAGLIAAIFVAMGLAGLAWAWLLAWPPERGRLAAATRLGTAQQAPAQRDTTVSSVALLGAAGLLLGALLWTVLSTLGFVAAPMLWVSVGVSNLELARLIQRVERRAGVVYYAAPPLPLFGGRQRLFVLPMRGA